MIQPVYPKDDLEYRKRVMEKFYKQLKDTKWEDPEEKTCKKKGRKSQKIYRPEAKPRLGEKYNWF
jgi:hypothetical protein